MTRHLSVDGHGRSGTATYHEAGRQIVCHWEFSGGDAVAIVQCGDESRWAAHPWAQARRAEILRYIAGEVVRQKAPSCLADVDLRTGDIVLREASRSGSPEPSSPPAPASAPASAARGAPGGGATSAAKATPHWYFRLGDLRRKLALAVLAAALLVGAAVWMKDTLFSIQPGKGTAIGLSVRTDRHVATLIQTLEPYVPSLHRDAGQDTYRISLFVVPLDGSGTRLVTVRTGLSGGAFGLARILGSDGRTLWFSVAGTGGVDLGTFKPRTAAEVAAADPGALPRPGGASAFPPTPEQHLAAGLLISPDTWLGLHSDAEAARDFQPQKRLGPLLRAQNAQQQRRFHLGRLERDAATGDLRILGMQALDDAQYRNAAFLRPGDAARPIRLDQPPGALMLYTAPGMNGTAVVARVDDRGRLLWQADTGIDRFRLQQILPGQDSTAFVGTRPPVPGKVSEPLLVIVEHATGRQVTHSLWQ